MSGIFKQVSAGGGGVSTEVNAVPWSGTGYNAVSGSNLTFTMAQLDPNNGRAFSNLYTSFNLPTNSARTEAFLSTWANTGFSGLSRDNIIVCEIVKNTYGELIDGRTIKLTLPNFSGGTFQIYSSYYEPEPFASDNSAQGAYFGHPRITTPSVKGRPGVAATNVAFLFSDLVKTPSIADTNTNINTWSDGWQSGIIPNGYDGAGTDNFRFLDTVTASNTPKADAESEDIPVGIAYLDKGFLVLTHPTIVNNFRWSGATTGGTEPYGRGTPTAEASSAFTQVYFSSATQAQCEFYSFEKEWEISINITAEAGEFYVTENQTAAPAESPYYGAGGGNTGIEFKTPFGDTLQAWDLSNVSDTYITEIGIFDNVNNLLAIAKPDRPIKKPKDEPVTLTLKLKF